MKKIIGCLTLLLLLGLASTIYAAEGKTMPEVQKELTNLALRVAKESFDIKLDFSHNSIRQVEKILSAFHDDYKKTKDDSGLNGIAFEFAAYIITTIEKNTEKGKWERDHPQFGEGAFPFYWKNQTLFPVEWCKKRIFDGPGDNVWSKYQVLVLKKAKSSK
jgi:hypothetical protein